MSILLTGATGFLGSNILKMLLQQNTDVIILKRSFSNTQRIRALLPGITVYNLDEVALPAIFNQHNIHLIIHCATDYGRKLSSTTNAVVNANLVLPLELMELSKKHKIKAFINTDTILDKRINVYTLSKKQFYEWMNFYKNDLICIDMSLEHFYGPNDDPSKFLCYIVQSLLANCSEIPLTPGGQQRDFIYIDDVVSAFDLVIKNLSRFALGKIYHFEIGSGEVISIKNLVLQLKNLTGNTRTTLLFGKLPYRDGEMMRSKVNLTHIETLGWRAKTTLLEGLTKTIAFEKEHMRRE